MTETIRHRLLEAERELSIAFPKSLFEYLLKLTHIGVYFGDEGWLVDVANSRLDSDENCIVERSKEFSSFFGLKGLVFADNGIGDVLLVMPQVDPEMIYVMLHETSEIKTFAKDINDAVENGPYNYLGTNQFVYMLEGETLVEGVSTPSTTTTEEAKHEHVSADKTAASTAYAFWKGIDRPKDLSKALEYALHAMELGKLNSFAGMYRSEFGMYMYEDLVQRIQEDISGSATP